MKYLLALLLAVTLHAAQGPAVLDKPQLIQFSATPLYDDAGKLLSLQVTAKFKVVMLMPDGKERRPHIRSIEFDLKQGGSVTIEGQIVEFVDFAGDILAITQAVWDQQNPGPLPTRRKALRTP